MDKCYPFPSNLFADSIVYGEVKVAEENQGEEDSENAGGKGTYLSSERYSLISFLSSFPVKSWSKVLCY